MIKNLYYMFSAIIMLVGVPVILYSIITQTDKLALISAPLLIVLGIGLLMLALAGVEKGEL